MTPGVFTNHDPGVPRPIEIFSQWGERAAMGPCGSLWKSRRDFQGPVDGRTRGVGCPRCAPAVHRTGSFHRVARSPSHRCRLLVVVVFVARPRWPREGQLSAGVPARRASSTCEDASGTTNATRRRVYYPPLARPRTQVPSSSGFAGGRPRDRHWPSGGSVSLSPSSSPIASSGSSRGSGPSRAYRGGPPRRAPAVSCSCRLP